MRTLALLFVAACQAEYTIPAPMDAWGEPNPRDLPPDVQVDRILQVVQPAVDVLFVVDNSPSMDGNRADLALAFPRFIEPFSAAAVDWHVGVVTTDMETPTHSGRLQERRGFRWIEPGTPDLVDVFTAMTTVGLETGTLEECGRQAAFTALEIEDDDFNEGFLRYEATGYLHINVVSDEDDDSEDSPVSAERFVDLIDLRRPYRDRRSFNSVVALQDTGTQEIGAAYIDLTERIGGQVLDLEGDWGEILADLAGLQAPVPMDEFFLSRLPVPETIEVHVQTPEGATLVLDAGPDWMWIRERNSVKFAEPPAIGSAIEVRYQLAVR